MLMLGLFRWLLIDALVACCFPIPGSWLNALLFADDPAGADLKLGEISQGSALFELVLLSVLRLVESAWLGFGFLDGGWRGSGDVGGHSSWSSCQDGCEDDWGGGG